MKRLYTLLLAALAFAATAAAQQTELSKALQKYHSLTAFTADVTQTRHRAALADADEVSRGQFYYKRGKGQCMRFEPSGDMLLATSTAYTMVRDGKQRTVKANGKGYNPFEAMTAAMRQLIGKPQGAIAVGGSTVKVSRQGDRATVTVTPAASDAKSRRRQMFTSAVATVDLNSSEVLTFRIDERNDNYILYTFSNYRWNATVSDGVFSTTTSSSSSSSSSSASTPQRRKR